MQMLVIEGNQKRYEIIDFLKGFSILTIVIMHIIQGMCTNLPGAIVNAASIGGTGVHVFIFCSGFGLYLSYLRNPMSLRKFIKKRFGKIYIPYIIVIFISALIPFTYLESDRIIAVLSHVFLFKMFVPKYECSFGTQFWFISTIFQFYLIFILLCNIKKKLVSNRLFGVLGLLISILWWIFITIAGINTERIWNSFFLQYLWEFVLGMLVAEYLQNGKKLTIKVNILVICTVVGLSMTMIMTKCGKAFKSFNDIFAFIGYISLAVIVYIALNGRKNTNSKKSSAQNVIRSFFAYISRISYEWYLVHFLCMLCAIKLFKLLLGERYSGGVMDIIGLVTFVFSIFVADLYNYAVVKVQKFIKS